MFLCGLLPSNVSRINSHVVLHRHLARRVLVFDGRGRSSITITITIPYHTIPSGIKFIVRFPTTRLSNSSPPHPKSSLFTHRIPGSLLVISSLDRQMTSCTNGVAVPSVCFWKASSRVVTQDRPYLCLWPSSTRSHREPPRLGRGHLPTELLIIPNRLSFLATRCAKLNRGTHLVGILIRQPRIMDVEIPHGRTDFVPSERFLHHFDGIPLISIFCFNV